MTIKNAAQTSKLCILSYNSKGLAPEKQEFCKLFTSKAIIGDKLPILCNQENFVLHGNSYKINQTFPDFHCIIKPAIKDTHDKGRAKNGMFIAIPETLKSCVNDVSPAFWRIQAVTIKSASSILLSINSYFPNDPRTANFDDEALIETFDNIKRVIDSNEFDLLCLCGDINADFSRNTGFVNTVQQQVDDLGLSLAWNTHEIDFTFAYNDAQDISHVAVLDHFFWNSLAESAIHDAGVLHIPENTSDHSPIFCTIDIDFIIIDRAHKHVDRVTAKPSWKKATDEEKIDFTRILDEELGMIVPPGSLLCTDVKCKDVEHCNNADKFITEVLETDENDAAST